MRSVLFIHAAPPGPPGGAELSLAAHVQGAPVGVRVDCAGIDDERPLDGYDAVVLWNLRGGSESQDLAVLRRWTLKLQNYRGTAVRSERDVHPCARRDGTCLVGSPLQRVACECTMEIGDAVERLYDECNVVQFLSPLHQAAIEQLVTVRARRFVIAPSVDLSRFVVTVPPEEREPVALIMGDDVRVAPGAEQRARTAGYRPERLSYLSIRAEEMPALYNRYRAVVVDPVMLHAFGRVVIEALACGCELLASERVGAMSWPDPLAACRRSNEDFWRMVLRARMPRWLARLAPGLEFEASR
jgi:hypothetical protein